MAAVLSQARQIASDIIATDHVEHCLNPMTCGDFQHRLDKIGSGIVDRMGRSNLQRSRAFFVTAAGDDDLHATQAAQRTRSEEHKSELQSLMRIPNAVLCLTKNKKH